jgi:2OG-Fe(II) oxygenase superfamily
MLKNEFLTTSFDELISRGQKEHENYTTAEPFPHICMNDLFNPAQLRETLTELPDLGATQDIKFNNPNELKLASRGEYKFGNTTTQLVHLLNSQPFLEFLGKLTGITGLIPDPYFWGGGYHQIKQGGYLKIYADFNKHPYMNLDRRLNLLVYLNMEWEESYGGYLEFWDKDMKKCQKRVLPVFGQVVIFNTTDYSFHGHPDPLTCPPDRSRKSLALYYYTNGRPSHEVAATNRITTNFQARKGQDGVKMKNYNGVINLITDLTPPLLLKAYKKIKNH